MATGLWVNKNTFVDFNESASKQALVGEIASRQSAGEFSSFLGMLPDPDPVLAKLGDSAKILEDLTADDHLCSVIQQRKVGTLKREFKWTPGVGEDEEKETSQAVALCKDFQRDIKKITFYDLFSEILDAPLYGYTPLELSWEVGDGHLKLNNIVGKPHRWFGFSSDENDPRFISQAATWEGEELPFGKFVFARHQPTYDNPFGLRLLSRCFWPVAFKRGGLKFWVSFCEKFGTPFLLGRFPKGTGKPQQDEMLANLHAMVQAAVAVVPEGSTVETVGVGSASKASSDLFARLVSTMDKSMSKVIVGQTLTSETSDKGGSLAQGQVHENVLESYRDTDQMLIKSTMEKIAAIYGVVNAPGVAPPTFSWFEAEDPKKEFAERDKDLKDTGIKFTKKYYQRQYNLKEDDFDIDTSETTPNSQTIPDKLNPGEFSEVSDRLRNTSNPELDEIITDKLGNLADPEISSMVETIRNLVLNAGSLEDIRDRILDLGKDMATDKLAAAMALALNGANLAGRIEVADALNQE